MKIGQKAERGGATGTVFAASDDDAESAAEQILEALEFSESEVEEPDLLLDVVGFDDLSG